MQIRGGKLEYDNKPKNSKISKLILTFIILIFILIIAIICTILYIKTTAFKAYVDGVSVNMPEDIIMIDENTNKVYVNIKKIAEYVGYDAHNGEYKLYTEDTNKCWVDCKEETASFYLNSNKISKVVPDTTKDYEDYTISDPVISKNGELYASTEGIGVGFNITIKYDAESNRLDISTLPSLVKYYNTILTGYGYEGISEEFNNQKAILYNLFVVKKENGLYGVVDSNNNEIIGSRYKSMEFNESAGEFYVSDSTDKLGIVTVKGVTKIAPLYDSIMLIDKQNGLYLVKSNNKYGVLNAKGETVIYLEYDDIGVDTTKFPTDTIKNQYILFESVIPVCQNKKWGLFNINGTQVIKPEYDYLGYTIESKGTSSEKVVNNLLIIPNYKAIVFGKDREKDENGRVTKVAKYGIYDETGKELVPCALDTAYSILNAGVNTYYMEYQGQTLDIEQYIQRVHKKTPNAVETQTNTTSTTPEVQQNKVNTMQNTISIQTNNITGE